MGKMGKPRAVHARATALDRAAHGAKPVALSAAEKVVLADAIREGTGLADELESKVMAYGRYLLAKVFANDTSAALDEKSKNPVWTELVRRAGGPTLRLNRHMLYVSVKLAAWDQRIQDEAFDRLDAGRKELLLPLADAKRMRDAANHVSKLKLTQTDTRQYVTQLLAEGGKSRQVRLGARGLVSRTRKLHQSLAGAAVLRQVKKMRAELGAAEREEVASEIEKLRDVLAEIARTLKKG